MNKLLIQIKTFTVTVYAMHKSLQLLKLFYCLTFNLNFNRKFEYYLDELFFALNYELISVWRSMSEMRLAQRRNLRNRFYCIFLSVQYVSFYDGLIKRKTGRSIILYNGTVLKQLHSSIIILQKGINDVFIHFLTPLYVTSWLVVWIQAFVIFQQFFFNYYDSKIS